MSETETPTVKFCIDCRWFKESGHDKTGEYDKCYFPELPQNVRTVKTRAGTSWMVRGETEFPEPFTYCDSARREDNCGREAKFFQPKEEAAS